MKYYSNIFKYSALSGTSSHTASNNTVLIIKGPSCSGKSTLAEQTASSLGPDWKLIELDSIEDQLKLEHGNLKRSSALSDEELKEKLIEEVNHALVLHNVVVDTNLYDKSIERKINTNFLYRVLIYSPLEVLLDRDQRRTTRLKRNEQKAAEARNYVLKTFHEFQLLDDASFFDLKIDTSVQSKTESLKDLMNGYAKQRTKYSNEELR